MSQNSRTAASRPAIRRLWPGDIPAFRDHLRRLDPVSRSMRFGGAVSDDFLEDYAAKWAPFGNLLLGAFDAGRLIGVAELRMLLEAGGVSAEAALSVEKPYQDRGIGDALLSRLIVAAQNRGIRSLYMMCLSGNTRMRHLAHKHEAAMEFAESEVKGTLHHTWPDVASLTEEMLGEAFGFTRALLRL